MTLTRFVTHKISDICKEIQRQFWQTKSNVQPLGQEDEWNKMKQMPQKIKAWADRGKSKIKINPTKVRDLLGHPVDRLQYSGIFKTWIKIPDSCAAE